MDRAELVEHEGIGGEVALLRRVLDEELRGARVSKLSLTELRSVDGGPGDTSHVVSPPLAGASRGV